MNSSGPVIDRSTCVSAAKFTIASQGGWDPIASVDGGGILDRALEEANLRRHVLQVLAPAGVRQLVEHGDLVAVLADALAYECRADEAGAPADEQLHRALTAGTAERYSASPSRQSASDGTSSRRSEPSTL